MVHSDAALYRTGSAYSAFNAAIGIEGAHRSWDIPSIAPSITTKIASFQCPSDNEQVFSFGGPVGGHRRLVPPFPWSATKGNYGVNWGNADYGQGVRWRYLHPQPLPAIPIRHQRDRDGPRDDPDRVGHGRNEQHAFVSEILQGAADDIRGTIWNDHPGTGSYMTRFTPNGYQDYVPMFQPWASAIGESLAGNTMDNLATLAGSGPGTSPPSPGSCATASPPRGLACYNQGKARGRIPGSRSRHPGGVNSLFGDGSVHFMKNSISAMTWVQLGSISGGEVISSDSY